MQRKNEKDVIKQKRHSKLDLESSTQVVSQNKQQRRAWKTLNQVQGDGPVYYNNNAFTLIELLVVVLIIGILAAVAVPQYQKAVDKARLMKLVAMTKNVVDAEESYYLANGAYTQDWDSLSVALPGTVNATNKTIIESSDGWKVRLHVADGGAANGLTAFDDKLEDLLIYAFYTHNIPAHWQGKLACYAQVNNQRAVQLCKQVTNNKGMNSGADFYYVLASSIN